MVGKIIFAEGPLGVEFHHANIVRIILTDEEIKRILRISYKGEEYK
jgi:hypothetical protein